MINSRETKSQVQGDGDCQ